MTTLMWIVPIIGILALIVAAALASFIKKQPEGTDRMKEIATAIHEGAQAFLKAEYKILAIIIVIVFLAVGFFIGSTQSSHDVSHNKGACAIVFPCV